ncbi:unnamed protein product [Bursaphelenchus xylophilus]|uniref:(pine wood nematode) hypothetical protein n=1 Tax=Bursaphelenchus xylophilus TaxID=6326 RepID=A0A1I7SWS4_BURXY|nr:unnamed protein product [Bursaphelenchus xylophilus]CAG9099868.1 unnamed protein product [Bursaphelenchus xylophilus]
MPPKRKSTTESQIAAKTAKKGGPPPDTKYKTNDIVMCKYGGTFYEAKVLAIDPDDGYFIHYQGWNKRYDGFVSFQESNSRFKPFSEEEVKKAKEVKAVLKEKASTPKIVKPKGTPKTKERSRNTSTISEEDKPSKDTPAGKPRLSSRTAEKQKPDGDGPRAQKPKKEDNVNNGNSNSTIPRKRLEAPAKLEPGTKLIGPDLAEVLTDEQEMITRRYRLPKTPAQKTVYNLIEDYCNDNHVNLIKVEKMMEFAKTKNLAEPTNITRADCCAGLLNLFEVCVASVLIYPFEREHIKTLVLEQSDGEDENRTLRLSRFLGVTYLLRMLSRIHEILEKTDIPEENGKTVMEVCTGITKHLCGKLSSYFDPTSYYVQPASDYIRRNSNLS